MDLVHDDGDGARNYLRRKIELYPPTSVWLELDGDHRSVGELNASLCDSTVQRELVAMFVRDLKPVRDGDGGDQHLLVELQAEPSLS